MKDSLDDVHPSIGGLGAPRRAYAGWAIGKLRTDDGLPSDASLPPFDARRLVHGETWVGALIAVTDARVARHVGCCHYVVGAVLASDVARWFPWETMGARTLWDAYRATFETDPGPGEILFVVSSMEVP